MTAIPTDPNKPKPAPISKTESLSRKARVGLALSAITLYSVGLLIAAAYVSYKAPIKPDRYGHAFSGHLADRLTAYALWLKSPSKTERATMPIEKINEILAATSARHAVDACLVYSVALWESGLNPHSISSTGAVGLMALQPATARLLSVDDPFDPYANADAGARRLEELSRNFDGNVDMILAAYNGGAGAVTRFQGVPPYRETADYVKHVGHIYRICKAEQ